MSAIEVLSWIKATKENFAMQFLLPARSSIKIANLLRYSFGLPLLECGKVATANDIFWAFLPYFRAKTETCSEGCKRETALKETKRVSSSVEGLRLLTAPSPLQAGFLLHTQLAPCYTLNWLSSLLGFTLCKNDILLFCSCHSLSPKLLYNEHTHGSFCVKSLLNLKLLMFDNLK